MGNGESSEKMHCNRYLNGQGPPSLEHQVKDGTLGTHKLPTGCQPEGRMTWVVLHKDLPGFPNDNTLQINYIFSDGIQTEKHPHPGQPYPGMRFFAYLPDNRDGRKVLKLLEKAFNQQLLFTVATNEYGDDVVSASSIPLKTEADIGGTNGYPDPEYLKTVRLSLKGKGIE